MAPNDRIHEAAAKIVVTGEPKVGSIIELTNANNTGVRVWHWSILPPDGSEAFLVDPMSSKPSFKIDRPGAYAVRLRVNAGPHESVDRTAVLVADAPAPDPFAGALKLLEGSSYAGFVVAAETRAGGTMICACRTTISLRSRVTEQMVLRRADPEDSREVNLMEATPEDDRPTEAVAQLRDIAEWLRAEGEGSKADDADELAHAIAFKYEVE